MNPSVEPSAAHTSPSGGNWKLQLGILCGMLVLALIGAGLSQATARGAWEFWLVVVVVYAAIAVWRSTQSAQQRGQPVRPIMVRLLSHWGVLLVFLAILYLLEQREIINRQSASDFALLLLAFTCCLAGTHFDWLFVVVGAVLTVMLVAMATLEQYSVVLWILMIAAAVGAALLFFLRSRKGHSAVEPLD